MSMPKTNVISVTNKNRNPMERTTSKYHNGTFGRKLQPSYILNKAPIKARSLYLLYYIFFRTFVPPMYGTRTSGTVTVPSSF